MPSGELPAEYRFFAEACVMRARRGTNSAKWLNYRNNGKNWLECEMTKLLFRIIFRPKTAGEFNRRKTLNG